MQKDINVPAMAIVNDLDALITEMDENPHLSAWVVRLVLKSIKEKAKKMVYETPFPSVSSPKISHLEAVPNPPTIGTSKAIVLG